MTLVKFKIIEVSGKWLRAHYNQEVRFSSAVKCKNFANYEYNALFQIPGA